jgi:hypothetical protein
MAFKSITQQHLQKKWHFPALFSKSNAFLFTFLKVEEAIFKTISGSSPNKDLSNNITLSQSQYCLLLHSKCTQHRWASPFNLFNLFANG